VAVVGRAHRAPAALVGESSEWRPSERSVARQPARLTRVTAPKRHGGRGDKTSIFGSENSAGVTAADRHAGGRNRRGQSAGGAACRPPPVSVMPCLRTAYPQPQQACARRAQTPMTGPIDTAVVRDAASGMAGFKFMPNAGCAKSGSARDRNGARPHCVCRYLSRLHTLGMWRTCCMAMSSTARARLWINTSDFGILTHFFSLNRLLWA
jgi:hypothetical protein